MSGFVLQFFLIWLDNNFMKKIIVIGTTGSGKSTVAKALSGKLGFPYIQLDAIFWKPNWNTSSDDEFFDKIQKATDISNWVLDGNYGRSNHLTWKYADTVVWVDFPFWLTFYQSLTRTLKRSLTKKEIWKGTGSKESLSRLFSKDSIILWLFKTYNSNVRRYEARLSDPKFSHIKFYRLRSRKHVQVFLDKL